MKTLLLVLSALISSSLYAANCAQDAETAAEEQFRNLEYGCYGNARLVEKLNDTTLRVYVDPIGGSGQCSKKVYEVKFKDSSRGCSIVSVTRIGLGGI